MEVLRFFCQFSIFLLVEGFQLTTALRRSSRIKTGVWMNYLEHQALRSKSKSSKSVKNSLSCWGFPVYFAFLLILRISTGQRFKKERSVHEACMGWIMKVIECLTFVSTDSHSQKNSWRYSGFSFPFCWFCWFWRFQPASASGRSGLLMTLIWDVL